MKKSIIWILRILLFIVLAILLPLIIYSAKWVIEYYGNITMDEVAFHLFSPLEGVSSSIVNNYLESTIPYVLIAAIIILSILVLNYIILNKNKVKINLTFFNKKITIRYFEIYTILILFLFLGIQTKNTLGELNFDNYVKNLLDKSSFIEENYVDPRKVELEFPYKKRNLIYIFVESYESTYFSKDLGGADNINYLNNITKLTKENISFSNNNQFGGAISANGTGWTTGGMIAQTAGLPLKITGDISNIGELSDLAKGAYSIGDILSKEGYNQELLLSTDSTFGNRKIYFQKHGNYNIVDYYDAIEKNWIDEDYYVWWGYEDSLLFKNAKEEITKLSKEAKPFNFTMLTTNTHFPGGYLENSCDINYDDQIENVIACTSKQINDFIVWVKKQNFYKDTTIIICGDHLSMEPEYFNNIDENYTRTIYNLIINSPINPIKQKNRLFSTMDMYPTTLGALGIKIKGDRMALGTNLFSDKKTIFEMYGEEYVNEELNKRSVYYEKNILK